MKKEIIINVLMAVIPTVMGLVGIYYSNVCLMAFGAILLICAAALITSPEETSGRYDWGK